MKNQLKRTSIYLLIVIKILFYTVICSEVAHAQTQTSGFGLALDEDYFMKPFGLNDDRNYTLGFHFSIFNTKYNSFLKKTLALREFEDNLLPAEASFDVVAFTPNNIKAEEIQYNDRPYSNVLFLSLKRHGLNKDGDTYFAKTLYVGVLGTRLAEYFQGAIHKVMNSPEPKGWRNQISDGGEPTILYTQKKMSLLVDQQKFQLNHGYTYNLFYVTGASYNLGARCGLFNKESWLTDMSGFIGSVTSRFNKMTQKKSREIYVYANLNTNLNVYNSSLHGQFRDTRYRIPYAKTGFVTLDTSLGVGVTFNRTTFSIYHKLRSPEIWDTNYRYWHNWIGISLIHQNKSN
ncbi:lipid A-modifier LpxR family protein [Tenacibaculum sp. TC6]|uniref:lipid A-modifier LpxR family protein n=1 Tax=Tenacibaculum sp. TC6 TaxID=3423223 RepID=UPI003D35DE02